MRDATKEEQESVIKYIRSISKDTDINFFQEREQIPVVLKIERINKHISDFSEKGE